MFSKYYRISYLLFLISISAITILCSFNFKGYKGYRITFKKNELILNTDPITKRLGELLEIELWLDQKGGKKYALPKTLLEWEIIFPKRTPFIIEGRPIKNFKLVTSTIESKKSKNYIGTIRLGELSKIGHYEYIIRLTNVITGEVFENTEPKIICLDYTY